MKYRTFGIIELLNTTMLCQFKGFLFFFFLSAIFSLVRIN